MSDLGEAAQGVMVRGLLSHNAGVPQGSIGPNVEYPPGGDPPYIYAVQASGGRCNGHSVSERPPP